MEVILAVIRQKPNTNGHEYRAKQYDILLLDHKTAVDKQGKPTKYLPTFPLTNIGEEPRDEVLTRLYHLTGGTEHGGIKGERALIVERTTENGGPRVRESLSSFALFCVPINSRDKLNRTFVEKSPDSPGFFSLEVLIESLQSGSMNFPHPTKTFVSHLESWLKEKYTRPGALEMLFRQRADYRYRFSVNNPGFLTNNNTDSSYGSVRTGKILVTTDEVKVTAFEIVAKMHSIDKCDKVVINPLFGSGLLAGGKRKVRSPFWPSVPLDYGRASHTTSRKSSLESAADPDRYSLEERDQFPMHKYALEGDLVGIQKLLMTGYPHAQDRDSFSWTPLHCAAWCGHSEAVQLFLEANCSPNVVNNDDMTPLHLAAKAGYLDVVNILLEHPETDINVVDKMGRTPLDLCQEERSWQHQQVARQIKMASRYPRQIEVYVMDNTKKNLNLNAGSNTTVQQLNQQMLREYNMPETPYADIFTIWICSQSLELQLKPEHKPLEHMNSWKRRIVGMLTDGDPLKEDPHLKWRRNAKISLLEEREVIHPDAINLLFHEAYQNYINAFYPCKEQDVCIFSAILLYMNRGEYEQASAKAFLSQSSSKNLLHLVPASMLKNKSTWMSKILHQYKDFSHMMSERPDLRYNQKMHLQIQFLNNCRNLTVYGSAFFRGSIQQGKSEIACLIGVNDVGIHIINAQSRVMMHSYKYSEITWGLHQPSDFSLLEVKVVRIENRSSERGSPRNILKLRTKQAGMINHLMKKLAQMHGLMSSRTGH